MCYMSRYRAEQEAGVSSSLRRDRPIEYTLAFALSTDNTSMQKPSL